MAFTIAKPANNGTKVENPLPGGIQPVTITGIKDLGMVAVDAKFVRADGKTHVHKAEIIFTGANGGQCKKDATVSIHEKSFVYKLVLAVNGVPPADNFDLESLIGKNLIVLTEAKVSSKGNKYAKVTGVSGAQPGQQSFAAMPGAVIQAVQVPTSTNVGF